MPRAAWAKAAAVFLYAGFWAAVIYGQIDINGSPDGRLTPWELATAVAVTSGVFVGLAIGRWWATATGLIFVGYLVLPARCVGDGDGVLCYALRVDDLPWLLASTTSGVVAGVVLRVALGAASRQAAARRRPLPL